MTDSTVLHGARPVTELAGHIEALRRTPNAADTLAAMLEEQGPLFAGRGMNEAERLRGYILASFETTGLPARAVPFVLEELETGVNPYTVAAAGRALGGATEIPDEAPRLLVGAISRLRGNDDVVSFEEFEPTAASPGAVTAMAELARTLARLGRVAAPALADLEALIDAEGRTFSPSVLGELGAAVEAIRCEGRPIDDCCEEHHLHAIGDTSAVSPGFTGAADLAHVALEDQDGTRLSVAQAFLGRPTALAFFYTRCTNPTKCSLTVTRLAQLATLVAEKGLDANVAGITYDPGFDRPARLRAYGADRGITFAPRCRLLRTVGPFEPVREALDLGVGFGPVTVNRHRLDVVVLDASLAVRDRFERRLWRVEAVFEALRRAAVTA